MASAKHEVARRSSKRRDPRVDPDSIPAMSAVRAEDVQAASRDAVALRGKKRDPRAEPESLPGARLEQGDADAPADAVDVEVTGVEDAATPGESPRSAARPVTPGESERPSAPVAEERVSTSVDARLAALEPLFHRSAWQDIADRLGPPEKAAELPPALALVYALARREAAGDDSARGATELAIKSMASLLGVAPESTTALVLAKRLLRQNPASWRTRPAPPARLSLAIVLIGIAVGVAAGSFLSLEAFRSFKLF